MNEDYSGIASLLRVLVDAGQFANYGPQLLEKMGLKSPIISILDELNSAVDSGMLTEIEAHQYMANWLTDYIGGVDPESVPQNLKYFDQDRVSTIYFIQKGTTGPIKIGISSDVAARMATLQISCHEPLAVLGCMVGTYRMEATLHQKFLQYRIRGEWFKPAEEILTFIADNCKKLEVNP